MKEPMTPIAWIVRHKADTPDTRPALYFTEAEAQAHAAQYLPGFAVVVPLGDVAAARAQALEDAARALDRQTALQVQTGGDDAAIAQARRSAAAIRAMKDAP